MTDTGGPVRAAGMATQERAKSAAPDWQPLQPQTLVDHAIEAVGRPASASLAVASLRRGGTATILGMMPLAEKVGLSAMDLLSGKKLQGAIMGGNRFPVDIPRLVDFYLRGLLDLDSIVAETIPLEKVNEGFDKMRKGDAARSVIVFDQ